MINPADSTKETIEALKELVRGELNLCCVLSTEKCFTCKGKICKECNYYVHPSRYTYAWAQEVPHICRLCYLENVLPTINHIRISLEKDRKGRKN